MIQTEMIDTSQGSAALCTLDQAADHSMRTSFRQRWNCPALNLQFCQCKTLVFNQSFETCDCYRVRVCLCASIKYICR